MQDHLILNRYRPLEVKGEGGSGTVELCWDTRIQRRVAIKRMPITAQTTTGTVPGLAEARTGAMLSRPSIVNVLDFDTEGDEAFLIMEAVEGPSLSTLIDEDPEGMLSLDVVAAVFEAVCDALDFAHENQVLHLDIKPDNILIDMNGHPKVTDFGVSELADAQGFGQAYGGTIGYMPPEQIEGEELDQRTDEFALACVTYEMLTGRTPFMAKDLDSAVQVIHRTLPEGPSLFRDDIDPEADDILAAAMSPERADRFETIYDFQEALMPFLGDAKEGVRELKQLAAFDDELDEEPLAIEQANLWEQAPERLRFFGGRALSAALCWWVAALGLTTMLPFDTAACMLIAVLLGVAGALTPSLGTLLALCVLGLACLVSPELPIWAGIAAIAIAAAWFALLGRSSNTQGTGSAEANSILAVAPLGLVSFTALAPFVAGFCLPVKRAAAAAFTSACTALVLGTLTGTCSMQHFNLLPAAGSQQTALQLVTSPETWCLVAGWVLCAVAMSLCCSRTTRVSSIVGAILGTACLLLSSALASMFTTGALAAPSMSWAISSLVAGIAMCVIGALGAPYRNEGED